MADFIDPSAGTEQPGELSGWADLGVARLLREHRRQAALDDTLQFTLAVRRRVLERGRPAAGNEGASWAPGCWLDERYWRETTS